MAVCAQIIAFFVTARVTQFYCELFQAMGIPVLEMHSRKSQAQRTKAADQFRASKGACIMFSSDVSARGVDYPDVSLVAQVAPVHECTSYICIRWRQKYLSLCTFDSVVHGQVAFPFHPGHLEAAKNIKPGDTQTVANNVPSYLQVSIISSRAMSCLWPSLKACL